MPGKKYIYQIDIFRPFPFFLRKNVELEIPLKITLASLHIYNYCQVTALHFRVRFIEVPDMGSYKYIFYEYHVVVKNNHMLSCYHLSEHYKNKNKK